MNSIKSSITVLFLLFVSYGVYRVIHTPDPTGAANGQFLVGSAQPTDQPTLAGANSPLIASDSPANPSASNVSPNELAGTSPLQLIKDTTPPPLPPPFTPSNTANPAPPLALATPATPPLSPLTQGSTLPVSPGQVPPPGSQADSLPGALAKSAVSPSGSMPLALPRQALPIPPNGVSQNTLIGIADEGGIAGVVPASGNETAPPMPVLGAAPAAETKLIAAPLTTPNSGNNTANSASSPLLGAAQANNSNPSQSNAAPPAASQWPDAREQAIAMVRANQMGKALRHLTPFYRADLSADQRTELLRWLDALASRVVYSTEHWLAQGPHLVQPGETLESVAQKWGVPVQLVRNVNRAKLPQTGEFVPGLELKSFPGPFRCEIDANRSELTLFVGDLYAGRFAITLPSDVGLQPGRFLIRSPGVDEQTGQVPFLEVDNGLTIAGTANSLPNSIVLSDADAQDVLGILSNNSEVTVLR